jgi:hypothetical protein
VQRAEYRTPRGIAYHETEDRKHGHRTAAEAVRVVKQMAGQYPDDIIACTLNRLGFSTGYGNTWKKHLGCSLRNKLDLPTYNPSNNQANEALTAERLGVSMRTVRELYSEPTS